MSEVHTCGAAVANPISVIVEAVAIYDGGLIRRSELNTPGIATEHKH